MPRVNVMNWASRRKPKILRALLRVVPLLGSLSPVSAETGLTVQLTCPERQGSGRVVCEVGVAGLPPNSELAWADALVVKTPAFVKPLRARVAAPVFARGAQKGEWSVAFVAEEVGRAEVTVRGRAVVCATDRELRRCQASERSATAEIVVRR